MEQEERETGTEKTDGEILLIRPESLEDGKIPAF